MRQFIILMVLVCCAALFAGNVFALDIPLGNKALNTGVVNPPGFNFIYEAQFYYGQSQDSSGKNATFAGKSITEKVFATDFVAEWHTKAKLFGANYSMDIVVPFVAVDVKAHNKSLTQVTGLGDIYVDPVMLGWSTKYLDSKFILGLNLPIGTPGLTKDHFSATLNGAFTIFFNEARTIQLSLMPTFEVHTKNMSNGLTQGMDFVLKWGAGYTFGANTLGVIGYSYVKMTSDTGSEWTTVTDAGSPIPITKINAGDEYVHAIGLQYNRYIESINSVVCFLVNQEVVAANRGKGTRVHFTFVKLF